MIEKDLGSFFTGVGVAVVACGLWQHSPLALLLGAALAVIAGLFRLSFDE